ncbi:MAG: ATP-binding cassette domain-containing protein [Bacteroidota bacterium]|nr:ATP-binding cassette domain-containing protein [Bacteroidota bacterium]MDP4213472.1 ATP-binding cassette domain-containing protein [Bacteroidota bacterium]MDP4249781.1 ATP-binding cassette domain-containing protein [Bacteroidota bacterium]
MRITLTDAGKRFNREWIFRHLNYQFSLPDAYAITGPNGSGKSTLLQFVGGALMPSEGKISYSNARDIPPTAIFQYLSIAAPYLETVEEMTANEFFRFHQSFKPFLPGISIPQMLDIIGLSDAGDKQIRYYSSGMKQRVRLAQAFFCNTPVLLLDEPTTNLDAPGIALYHQLIKTYCSDRLVLVSSNDPQEYGFCNRVIEMEKIKKGQRMTNDS